MGRMNQPLLQRDMVAFKTITVVPANDRHSEVFQRHLEGAL